MLAQRFSWYLISTLDVAIPYSSPYGMPPPPGPIYKPPFPFPDADLETFAASCGDPRFNP